MMVCQWSCNLWVKLLQAICFISYGRSWREEAQHFLFEWRVRAQVFWWIEIRFFFKVIENRCMKLWDQCECLETNLSSTQLSSDYKTDNVPRPLSCPKAGRAGPFSINCKKKWCHTIQKICFSCHGAGAGHKTSEGECPRPELWLGDAKFP